MKSIPKTINQLADAAKAYDWPQTLALLKAQPALINSTRPGGNSLFTPLHQAIHGNAPLEVIQTMLQMGASLHLVTAEGERPLDIAQKKGYLHLAQFLEVYESYQAQQEELDFPQAVDNGQMICALRFKGYDYEIATGIATIGYSGSGIRKLIKPVVQKRILHHSDNDNFAAFFGLQRFLYKWGGEDLTKYADEHIAYDFLFLHLYSLEPPTIFQDPDYCLAWQRQYQPQAEKLAAFVRRSFRRVGVGKKSQI